MCSSIFVSQSFRQILLFELFSLLLLLLLSFLFHFYFRFILYFLRVVEKGINVGSLEMETRLHPMNVLLATEWKQALNVSLYTPELHYEQRKMFGWRAIDCVTVRTQIHRNTMELRSADDRLRRCRHHTIHINCYRCRCHRSNAAQLWTWVSYGATEWSRESRYVTATASRLRFYAACVRRMRYDVLYILIWHSRMYVINTYIYYSTSAIILLSIRHASQNSFLDGFCFYESNRTTWNDVFMRNLLPIWRIDRFEECNALCKSQWIIKILSNWAMSNDPNCSAKSYALCIWFDFYEMDLNRLDFKSVFFLFDHVQTNVVHFMINTCDRSAWNRAWEVSTHLPKILINRISQKKPPESERMRMSESC